MNVSFFCVCAHFVTNVLGYFAFTWPFTKIIIFGFVTLYLKTYVRHHHHNHHHHHHHHHQQEPRSQGPLSTSRNYFRYGRSRVYACQPKPHRGWVLNLILSTLSREVNVALLHRHLYFEKEASFVRDPASD